MVAAEGINSTAFTVMQSLVTLLMASSPSAQRVSTEQHQADLEDIRQSLNGDGHAYRRLVERHQQRIGRIMWRFTQDLNEHEELAHEVFVEAYQSLSNYRAESPFAHWLARIATRIGYRYWKQNKRQQQVRLLPNEMWDRLTCATNDGHDQRVTAEWAHYLLGQLPPNDRLVLTLRYLEGYDIDQAAYLAGWSKVRVRVQAYRAIRKLRKIAAEAERELDQ